MQIRSESEIAMEKQARKMKGADFMTKLRTKWKPKSEVSIICGGERESEGESLREGISHTENQTNTKIEEREEHVFYHNANLLCLFSIYHSLFAPARKSL